MTNYILKSAGAALIGLMCAYGAINFTAKVWYYTKVVRTVDRIMRSNGVHPQF